MGLGSRGVGFQGSVLRALGLSGIWVQGLKAWVNWVYLGLVTSGLRWQVTTTTVALASPSQPAMLVV